MSKIDLLTIGSTRWDEDEEGGLGVIETELDLEAVTLTPGMIKGGSRNLWGKRKESKQLPYEGKIEVKEKENWKGWNDIGEGGW